MCKYEHVCKLFSLNMSLESVYLATPQQTQKISFLFFNIRRPNELHRPVVDRPNHGPGVDVERGAASAGLASLSPVAHAHGVVCVLAFTHDKGNVASILSYIFLDLHRLSYTCNKCTYVLSTLHFLPTSLSYMHILKYICIQPVSKAYRK